MNYYRIPNINEIELPEVLAALSDPLRLSIVAVLADGKEHPCSAFDFGITRASMSHHFRVLRESGITITRASGQNRSIQLRKADLDTRLPGLLDSVIRNARTTRRV